MTIEKTIQYDHGDYKMTLDGRFVGYERTYSQAEIVLNNMAYEMLIHDDCATAEAMDGGADAPMLMPEGDWIDVEGMRAVAPVGMVVVQIATEAPESLREDCLNVVTMALGQTHGAASVVSELRRIKVRLELAAAQ